MEDEDDGAEGGEDGEEEPAGGFDGHGDRAEDDREEDDREADDEDAEGHERLAELVGDVDLDGRGPGDGGVEPIVVLDLGAEIPQPVDGVQGGRIVRGGRRDDLEQRGRRIPVRGGEDDLVDAGDRGDALLDVLDVAEGVVGGDDLTRHHQGSVEAGTEVLLDEVIGRPGGAALLLAAGRGRESWSWEAGIAKRLRPPTMMTIVSSGTFVTTFSQPEKKRSVRVCG